MLDQIRQSGFTKIRSRLRARRWQGCQVRAQVSRYAGPLLYRPPPRWQVWAAIAGRSRDSLCGGGDCFDPSQGAAAAGFVEHSRSWWRCPSSSSRSHRSRRRLQKKSRLRRRRPRRYPNRNPNLWRKNQLLHPSGPPSNKPVAPIARPTNRWSRWPGADRQSRNDFQAADRNIRMKHDDRRLPEAESSSFPSAPDGSVTDASMGQSTGSPILDNAATSAFRRARFKPGTVSKGQDPDHLHPDGRIVLIHELKHDTMKMRSPLPKKHARIEIIPLIDIMFFLLASFMMVSLSQTHMKGIRVNLPSANTPPPPPNEKKDYVSIRVTEGGTRLFRQRPGSSIRTLLPKLFATARSQSRRKGFHQRRNTGAAR